ncbi:MAG: hypothetical protein L0387_05005 [Acidobacteria bacterium]|nr:hypothetical protein [Acidobacteriota bacterium]MCI0719044.1 hypothetical protein [Acidobacteriota bacterium]
MRKQSKRTLRLWAALGSLLVTITAFSAADYLAGCLNDSYSLTLPDYLQLKLTDGQHVVASVSTKLGLLEARVIVKSGRASEPVFFVGGKQLQEVPETKIPKEAQECLNAAFLSPSHWLADLASSIKESIVLTAYAAGCVSAAGSHVFKAVDKLSDGRTVLRHTVNGRFCRWVIV